MPVPSRPSLSKLSELLEASPMPSDLPYTELPDQQLFDMHDENGAVYIKEIFTTSLFGGSRMTEQNITGVLVLLCIAFGIGLILLMCYFLIKICNLQLPPSGPKFSETSSKDTYRDHEIFPTKVLYPKRIYEIQAEEGYFSCPPSIQQSMDSVKSPTCERKGSIFDTNSTAIVKKCRDSIKVTIKRKLSSAASAPDVFQKQKLRHLVSANA